MRWGALARDRRHAVFGSNTVNSLRFTYNRSASIESRRRRFEAARHRVGCLQLSPHVGVFIVSGNGFQINNPGPSRFTMQASQISDDLTLVRGDHQIAVGGSSRTGSFISCRTRAPEATGTSPVS
jgi:hypothetical protein